MNSTWNHQAIMEALLRGDKIQRKNWSDGDYLHLVNGEVVNSRGDFYLMTFDRAEDWQIYKEEPKHKEYFQMAVRRDRSCCWIVSDDLVDRDFKCSTGEECAKGYERKILEHTKVVL